MPSPQNGLINRRFSRKLWLMNNVTPFPQDGAVKAGSRAVPAQIFFHRKELDLLLRLYGRMVAAGEWRDYAMNGTKEKAVFAVFRNASEMPLYTIEKCPKLARKQGAYCLAGAQGQILKRGHELGHVLAPLEAKALKLVD